MKYIIFTLVAAVGAFALSARPAAAQCTTTVTGNSGDDPVYIIGCTSITSSSTTVRNRGFAIIRNRVTQNSGNTVIAGEDMVNVNVQSQGSSLTQNYSYFIGVINITF